MALRCTGISKRSGRNGEQIFFNFRDKSIDLTVELTGTPFAAVYDDVNLTSNVLSAIQAGQFDGEIEESTVPGDAETFIESLEKVLSHTN